MKKHITIILILLMYPAAVAAETAASCSKTDVQTAVTNTSAGGTVTVPAGECSWSSGYVSIGKILTISGAGSDNSGTVLTTTGNSGFQVTTGIDNVRISGIRWIASTSGEPIVMGNSNNSSTGNHGWRIFNSYFSGYGVPIRTMGLCTGLIDSNTFYGFTNGGDGINIQGNNAGVWGSGQTTGLGTNNFVFIDNNLFDTANTRPNQVVSSFQGGRMVVRYNTFQESGTGSWGGVIDVHGNGHGSDVRAGRAWEFYNNTFKKINDNWTRAIHIRGGTGVVYGNSYETTGRAWDVYTEFQYYRASLACSGGVINDPPGHCDPASATTYGKEGYPCSDQQGRGEYVSGTYNVDLVQASEPIYLWGNVLGGTAKNTPLITSCTYNATAIQADRDYYAGSTAPGYTAYTYPHPLAGSETPRYRRPWSPFAEQYRWARP
jgi:hypothetical protein